MVASVVGIASDTQWGQVLTTPHAYGVVEVYSPDGIARVRGIQLLTKLIRLFLTPPVSLSKLSVIADSLVSEDVVSLVLLVPVGATLYLAVRGVGAVFLKRGSALAPLLSGPGELSGDVKIGDTVIAASQGFVSALTVKEIMNAFDHLAPQDVAEKLNLLLHERGGSTGGAAALIFQMKEEPRIVAPPPPVPQTGRTIFLSRARSLGRRVTTPAVRLFLRRILTRIREAKSVSPRHLLVYGVIALFGLSVVLGVRREYANRRNNTVAETVKQARFSFDEGMALLELNPVKGRERLTAARDLIAPVVAKKKASTRGVEAQELYDEIVSSLTRAMRITHVSPEPYFDMGLVKSAAVAGDMSLYETTIGIADSKGLTAFTVGLLPKTGTIVGGGSAFDGMSHVALYGDKLYVLTTGGIHQIRLSDQKTVPNTIPASTEWGTIADMAVFGGNVYLLDTAKSRIWKYVATGESLPAGRQGFSQLFEYLNPDTLPDLTKTTNMAIDGSVWLGTTTGSILRFTAGKENSFTPQGADTPLGKTLMVFTDADTKMLYVLDRDNNRIVVFDKDGLYMAQYVWGKDFQPSAFVVSEKAGKMLLLRDGKIYTLDLK